MVETRIGISGWRYEPWRGTFYPKGLPQKKELEFASRQLNSIEINGTFYSLQWPSSFKDWHDATPKGFLFSVKCPQFITHIRRLREIDEPLANFYGSGVLALGEKLGPMLWQFPPNFKYEEERFATFFEKLPRDLAEAAKLGRKHSDKIKGRAWAPEKPGKQKIRHAVEIRHESFLCESFIRLLRKWKIALVIADTAGLHPFAEDVTADFLYLRLHGAEEIYASGYTEEALDRWAGRLKTWQSGGEPADAKKVLDLATPKRKSRDAYVYFDNDMKVRAPVDAQGLAARMAKSR